MYAAADLSFSFSCFRFGRRIAWRYEADGALLDGLCGRHQGANSLENLSQLNARVLLEGVVLQ
jgi:hypothetical protein